MLRTPTITVATAVLLAVTSAASAAPTIAFSEPTQHRAGNGAWLLAAGDLNGDGRPDLGVANIGALGSNAVSLLVNTTQPGGAAAFAAPQGLPGYSGQAVTFADLDSDGKPEVIATDQPFTREGRLRIWRNLTNAGASTISLATPITRRTGTTPEVVVAEDMDHDRRPDLVVANFGTWGPHAVTVYRNTTSRRGQISFGPAQNFTGGAGAEGMTVADLDDDGLPEVITGNTVGDKIAILRNHSRKGAIGLGAPQFVATNDGPTAVAAADLNNDGRTDLAVGSSFSGPRSLTTLVNTTIPGAAEFTFNRRSDYALSQGTEGITTTDLDADGRDDVVLAQYGQRLTYNSGGLTILRNTTPAGDPDLTFDPPQQTAPGPATVAVVACDINSDGRADLAAGNFLALPARAVTVVLNQT